LIKRFFSLSSFSPLRWTGPFLLFFFSACIGCCPRPFLSRVFRHGDCSFGPMGSSNYSGSFSCPSFLFFLLLSCCVLFFLLTSQDPDSSLFPSLAFPWRTRALFQWGSRTELIKLLPLVSPGTVNVFPPLFLVNLAERLSPFCSLRKICPGVRTRPPSLCAVEMNLSFALSTSGSSILLSLSPNCLIPSRQAAVPSPFTAFVKSLLRSLFFCPAL